MNTVTYRTAAAPYLAVHSLPYVADKYKEEFSTGASVIKSSFYVDDLLCGADDMHTLQLIKQEVIEFLQKENFLLTKWHSNHPEFTDCMPTKRLNILQAHAVSFGTRCCDSLHLCFAFGLLSPIIIVAKMTLQELWTVGSGIPT